MTTGTAFTLDEINELSKYADVNPMENIPKHLLYMKSIDKACNGYENAFYINTKYTFFNKNKFAQLIMTMTEMKFQQDADSNLKVGIFDIDDTNGIVYMCNFSMEQIRTVFNILDKEEYRRQNWTGIKYFKINTLSLENYERCVTIFDRGQKSPYSNDQKFNRYANTQPEGFSILLRAVAAPSICHYPHGGETYESIINTAERMYRMAENNNVENLSYINSKGIDGEQVPTGVKMYINTAKQTNMLKLFKTDTHRMSMLLPTEFTFLSNEQFERFYNNMVVTV